MILAEGTTNNQNVTVSSKLWTVAAESEFSNMVWVVRIRGAREKTIPSEATAE